MVVIASASSGAHKLILIAGKQSNDGDGCSTSSFGHSVSDTESNSSAGPTVRKRQRLTHLSPEEKALRRKLKNRVAAQTARDRKKAKMGELEQQVLELELENQKLQIENRLLRGKNNNLLTENDELKHRLGQCTLDTKGKVIASSGKDTGLGIGSSESSTQATCASAAGADPAVPKPEDFSMDTALPDSADNESDLLLGMLDILDPELLFTSCEQLQVDGGNQVLAASPGPLGTPSIKLEALNGLIHLDHIYTKPAEVAEANGEENDDDDDDEDDDDDYNHNGMTVSFPAGEVVVEEDASVKDEPEELVISRQMDEFLCMATIAISSSTSSSPSLSGKEACLADNYSDSGYEGSPSPFSDIPSPLCSVNPWDNMTSELFPQLISF
ncbi:LOW QUALITY PROTEIN: X-box-binding protein 1 [Stigmatopora argus]